MIKIHRNILPENYFTRLAEEVDWGRWNITVNGWMALEPRDTAYYGDYAYSYSGSKREPLPFIPVVEELKKQVEVYSPHEFNSCLLNYYKEPTDYIGLHSDDEKELGPKPVIATLSIGGARLFTLEEKATKHKEFIQLGDGDLLIMYDDCQKLYRHGVEKNIQYVTPRISLTFRKVFPNG